MNHPQGKAHHNLFPRETYSLQSNVATGPTRFTFGLANTKLPNNLLMDRITTMCNSDTIDFKVTDTDTDTVLDDHLKKPAALSASAFDDKNNSDYFGNEQLKETTVEAKAEAVTASTSAEMDDKMTELIFGDKTSFPLNLTRMLESVEAMGLTHIIRWTNDGKKFVIYDVDAFLNEVLPKFFK